MDPNKPKRVMQADTRRLGEHLPLNRQTRPDLFRDAEEQRQVAADTRARFDRMEASSRADLARIQEAERWENGPPSEEFEEPDDEADEDYVEVPGSAVRPRAERNEGRRVRPRLEQTVEDAEFEVDLAPSGPSRRNRRPQPQPGDETVDMIEAHQAELVVEQAEEEEAELARVMAATAPTNTQPDGEAAPALAPTSARPPPALAPLPSSDVEDDNEDSDDESEEDDETLGVYDDGWKVGEPKRNPLTYLIPTNATGGTRVKQIAFPVDFNDKKSVLKANKRRQLAVGRALPKAGLPLKRPSTTGREYKNINNVYLYLCMEAYADAHSGRRIPMPLLTRLYNAQFPGENRSLPSINSHIDRVAILKAKKESYQP